MFFFAGLEAKRGHPQQGREIRKHLEFHGLFLIRVIVIVKWGFDLIVQESWRLQAASHQLTWTLTADHACQWTFW